MDLLPTEERENEFEHAAPVPLMTVGMAAAAAREQSEIQAAIVSAKRFPRDEANCYAKIMKSFARPGLAEDALWSFKRGGSTISGPSVQCARELARCWGNMMKGVRVIDVDETYVHIKGWCYDIESNMRDELEDKFEKKIQRRNRSTGVTEWVTPDERDLRELVNRRGAILERNTVLKCIPPDIVEDAVTQARKTMQQIAAGSLKDNRHEVVKAIINTFAPLGVNVPMLQDYLGHSLDLLTEQQVVDLRSIARSLKDGNSRREEVFDVRAASAGADELNKRGRVDNGGDIVVE